MFALRATFDVVGWCFSTTVSEVKGQVVGQTSGRTSINSYVSVGLGQLDLTPTLVILARSFVGWCERARRSCALVVVHVCGRACGASACMNEHVHTWGTRHRGRGLNPERRSADWRVVCGMVVHPGRTAVRITCQSDHPCLLASSDRRESQPDAHTLELPDPSPATKSPPLHERFGILARPKVVSRCQIKMPFEK